MQTTTTERMPPYQPHYNEKYILFACPDMQSIADDILEHHSDHVEKGNITWEISL